MQTSQTKKNAAKSDKSFPVALNEQLERIAAEDALQLEKNQKYYCPKCVRINPEQRTQVKPSNHTPPRFSRSPRGKEKHLDECYYNRNGNYLPYITKKLNIGLQGDTVQLTVMNPDGKEFYRQDFLSRLGTYCQKDHHSFLKLIQEILTDTFALDYKRDLKEFQINEQTKKKTIKVSELLTSLEDSKGPSSPAKKRANLIVGKIKKSYSNSKEYHKLLFESSIEIRILIPRVLYSEEHVRSLLEQRVAVFGYVDEQTTKDGSIDYVEVFSFPHQLTLLDGLYADSIEPNSIQEQISQRLSDYLQEIGYTPLSDSDFHSLYADSQAELQKELADQIESITQQQTQQRSLISHYQAQIIDLHQRIYPKIDQIKSIEEQLGNFWTRLLHKKKLVLQMEELQQQIQLLEEQQLNHQRDLQEIQSQIDQQPQLTEETRSRLEQLEQDRANEIQWKEPIKGTIFRFQNKLVLSYQVDKEGKVSIYTVPIEKKKSYYIPKKLPEMQSTSLKGHDQFHLFWNEIQDLCTKITPKTKATS